MYRIRTVLILSLFSFNAFATLAPGPERKLSPTVYAPPAGEQRPGALASNGTDFLSVWTDLSLPRQGVYATRVTRDGNVSVASERLVRAGTARDVSVCFAGDGYLAAWSDDVTQSVYSAKLALDGSVVGGPRVVVAADVHDAFTNAAGTYPRALACNSTSALLVVKVGSTPMAEVLDSNGSFVRSGGTLPITDGDPIVNVAVGNTFFIGDESRTSGKFGIVRVQADGTISDASPVPIIGSFTAQQISMAFNGGTRLAVAAVNGTTLKRAFVDTTSMAVTNLPDVALGGQEVSVVNNTNFFDAYVRPLNSATLDIVHVTYRDNEASAPQPENVVHGDALGTSLIVASNGRDNLALWKDFRRTPALTAVDGDIYGALIGAAGGTNVPPFPIAVTAEWQNPVAIASSGTESMIVWNERNADADQAALLAARIDPQGALLDTTPKVIATAVIADAAPAITWDGSSYVVAWTEAKQSNFGPMDSVITQRVGKNGSLIGSTTPYDGAFGPALGSNGSSALLTFTYPDGRGSNFVLLKSGVTPAITPMNIYGYAMSIGASGSDYLVTWTEGAETCSFICYPDKRDVNGMRINGNGAILDSTPIAIANGPKDQAFPHVASNGTDYVIVYGTWDNIWSLASKRVTKSGQLVDSLPNQDGIVLATDIAPSSAIARDDSSFVVAYDFGSGTDTTAIRLMRLNDSGGLIEQSGSIGAATRTVPSSPSLVKVPGGPVDIAYSRFATEQTYGGTMRAFVRLAPDASAPPVGKSRAARH
jgi:hypothetical protein